MRDPATGGFRLASALTRRVVGAALHVPPRLWLRASAGADAPQHGFLFRGDWDGTDAETYSFSFDGGPSAPSAARDAARPALCEALAGDHLDDALVLLSELVMNAVVHAGAKRARPVEVELGVARDRVRAEVLDRGPGFDPELPSRRREGGFGMILLDRMADRWGTTRGRSRTCVWFELDRVPARAGERPARRAASS